MAKIMCVDLPEQEKEKIFKSLFELFNSRLLLFAESMLSANEEAADLVQEAFVALWQRMDSFDNLQAIKVFLYLTVKNKCLNIFKHEKVVRRFTDGYMPEPEDKHIMARLIEAEVLGEVQQALTKLPAGCRNVLHLSYFEGLRNNEIADRLNISINTVKTQKARALRLMRDLLKKQPFHFLFFFGNIF
ncbi:RNA polymerase sigma-70 factor (ECF subfamily) [Chitinophaga niastensis]|uniref:RNA polymerase sigma-70 factor (ECF subfamily) n=1 Tax=Chitinophaga niastensis TaxID=536980 RepID=A0A2P8H9F7_CHINA|nr:RNA polymerase sigma-70 factor [Chitinophaga niastensis]PSL42867.1 RNA polymerase sigma-70 factor (ECF subfamily) [Chitinophaga niastensis]